MQAKASRKAQGIEVRHKRDCRSRSGSRCNCNPTYRASVWSRREKRRIRRKFSSLEEAKAWRADAYGMVRDGRLKAPTKTTLREAAEAFLAGAESGSIRDRSGYEYKPSTIHGYREALGRILPEIGGLQVSEVERGHVQALADELIDEGLSPSRIRNLLMPLRSIYRRALNRGEVAINPTTGLELPAVRGSRERAASPAEAAQLIAALDPADRALWATAMYAGLRLGELRGLRWADVDFAQGVIRVERSWDERSDEPGETKGRENRRVPIIPELRDLLVEHKLNGPDGFVFGAGDRPFVPSAVRTRAYRRWEAVNAKEREAAEREGREVDSSRLLDRITPHECRHTFASLMIAAGVNAKAVQAFMGHKSITVTMDLYGHLMPGSEAEAADLLNAYLSAQRDRAADAVRQIGGEVPELQTA